MEYPRLFSTVRVYLQKSLQPHSQVVESPTLIFPYRKAFIRKQAQKQSYSLLHKLEEIPVLCASRNSWQHLGRKTPFKAKMQFYIFNWSSSRTPATSVKRGRKLDVVLDTGLKPGVTLLGWGPITCTSFTHVVFLAICWTGLIVTSNTYFKLHYMLVNKGSNADLHGKFWHASHNHLCAMDS